MIKNPVLTGFHPDPSMICVDGTFYVANSTFEYFPGVSISASKDLANWETVAYPLNEKRLLDMRGNPQSGGVWAPCLTHCGGLFYLVYTDVKVWAREPFKDTHNYITTAPAVTGPWSDPVYINSSGFDPSLFHDEDGRKYFVNMEWDYRKAGDGKFAGILLTELDPVSLKPISPARKIFRGTPKGLVEGPHLYKRNGYYYLLCAEGGTSYEHAESVCRSKNIWGPYEQHPHSYLCSTQNAPGAYLQKTGHGSICEGPDGRWWTAFLCGRPVDRTMSCPLGRETSISEIVWKRDWPYLKNGTLVPPKTFEGYGEKESAKPADYDFASKAFALDFMSLRTPAKYTLVDGALRLYGGESIASLHDQNLLVRRQCDFSFEAITVLRFPFDHFQQMAGLIYRYNEENQYFLRVAYDEERGCKTLGILVFDKFQFSMPLGDREIPIGDEVFLKVSINGRYGAFSYSSDGKLYYEIPYRIDASKLSDEYATPCGFTGAFVGMSCVDMLNKTAYADFLSFTYRA